MKINPSFIIFFIIFNLITPFIFTATIHEINVQVNENYKKSEFSSSESTSNHFFKYSFDTQPSSKISAFRFEFDQFSLQSQDEYLTKCTWVSPSASDDELIEALEETSQINSACIGKFGINGIFDGLVKHSDDSSKTKMGILLITNAGIQFTARIYLRTSERLLEVEEQTVMENEEYSLVPFTIKISDFREKASKIFFYSMTRELQMYYGETTTESSTVMIKPELLFSGNILNVFTNENMVRQKYHGANLMVLLTKDLAAEESIVGEEFKFQVKFFSSEFLVDYFISSNSEGRNLNSPLSLNMTQCDYNYPYFVIVNYNKPEEKRSLFIDQIYGQISSVRIATSFTQSTWDDMLKKDMKEIDPLSLKYEIPSNQKTHMDVYKIMCEKPLLLNFYYVDESVEEERELSFGDVQILTLKPYKTTNVAFDTSIKSPELTIHIFNPFDSPFVIINEGSYESVYKKNTILKMSKWNLESGIKFTERAGLSETRIIVKVGYSLFWDWEEISEGVKYNKDLNTYVYQFPNDDTKLNYKGVNLITSGTNADNNVKYCYITNIGSALKPSEENCYRVSSDNSYTLKVLNPSVMYKDYSIDPLLNYYVTFKPTQTEDKLTITPSLLPYDTSSRNYEGKNNAIVIGTETQEAKTILTAPENQDPFIFLQIQICGEASSAMFEVKNAYDDSTVIEKQNIPKTAIDFYKKFNNIYLESELIISGVPDTNVFVKHVGIPSYYEPEPKSSFSLVFDSNLNQLQIENPISNRQEKMKYIILVDTVGTISSKGFSLCSFTDLSQEKIDSLALYNKIIYSQTSIASAQLNFRKAGLKAGDQFEAIVYVEQEENSKMSFLSKIITGTVGEIKEDSIYEIKEKYVKDPDYVYRHHQSESSQINYYFSFMPDYLLDVPVGALRIEADSDSTGYFSNVACAFVEDGTDPMSMIEAVEEVIDNQNSFCIGGRNSINPNKYDYIFKYEYLNSTTPKRMVIKLSNGGYANGGFNIFVKNVESNNKIVSTDFSQEKEYGQEEESRMSVTPYIINLKEIRGQETSENKISKILLFSQHLEMQMYYIDKKINYPIKLFSGNLMLLYTKPALAEQKYHATNLILLSENLEGQQHASLGDTFRFHSKMYKSEDQIEYFVSNNPEGRTLNYPLSIEMNTCSSSNNKYYFILNYNKQEEQRTIHLDMIFGHFKTAKIASEINSSHWSSLIASNMKEIQNYQEILPPRSQHIDVVEITCLSPLLLNAYYNYDSQQYSNLKRGDILVKKLNSQQSVSFTLSPSLNNERFYYSVSAFNPQENPEVTVKFSDSTSHTITENALHVGILMKSPESIFLTNNGNSMTRIIFKIGLGVDYEWRDEKVENIQGKLYTNSTMFAYRFPVGASNKKNFRDVSFLVKSLEDVENVKFCYSTNLGMAIGTSMENCFRTGKNIPYQLNFVNPLIVAKNYKTFNDNYYISFRPFDLSQTISLTIQENQFNTLDRNTEGEHKVITILNNKASSILSLPEKETSKILVHLAICQSTTTGVSYINNNAYSGEKLLEGNLKYGEALNYYLTTNTLVENELVLQGGNVKVYTKHVAVGDYVPNIIEYKSTFDETKNVVSIIKPILNEEFTITVIVGKKGTLDGISLCTLVETQDKSTLGDYVSTFVSVSSNEISHYINFKSFSYPEGQEFDLLVYAEQTGNSKMEFLYPKLSGKVGKISGVLEISEFAPQKENLIVYKEFSFNNQDNYFYYDFERLPTGKVASLKIKSSDVKVTKIGCVFMKSSGVDDADMVNEVNTAVLQGKSVCLGESQVDSDGFDALINANYASGKNRLVIQVMYGFSDNENNNNNIYYNLKAEENLLQIYLRINGFQVDSDTENKYNEDENLAAVPYVIDLEKIRQHKLDQEEYVSKVMFYSSSREMQMFYISDTSPTPVSLFSGHIMLVYTNPDLIRQKYFGATTMILITDSLSGTSTPVLGEQFRYRVHFFNSAKQIQYYVSNEPDGRLLNNPTALEMISCNQPYYYIMNYHKVEYNNRKLHIDNIFGEIDTIKIATELNKDNWESLVEEMESFEGDQIILPPSSYHMDVIEVKCKIPLLLNLYYVNPDLPKISNLEVGDISIISLAPSQSQTLTFKEGLDGPFLYSYNVYKEGGTNPNIQLQFSEESFMDFKENGLYTKETVGGYESFTIKNKETSGSINTRIIFKFGYVIESKFKKIKNDIYNNQKDTERQINLFGYKFVTNQYKLNYTSVDFTVSTAEDNVKFCYSTNLGTYINPSLQNCFRVGKNNPYTISVLNPLVMYKNYYHDDVNSYYVGFRTVELNQNITITPKLNKYPTNERNFEGYRNKIILPKEGKYSTILTAPKLHQEYMLVHLHVCTKNQGINYNFLNAYNSSSLGYSDEIQPNSKNNFRTIPNTKLDTELDLNGKPDVQVFVKHVGISQRYQPVVKDIIIEYNNETKTVTFNQPINGEDFLYTVFIDKKGNLLKQNYTLCSIVDATKLAHYQEAFSSNEKKVEYKIDFSKTELKGYEDFDIMILAEQKNLGKLTILSDVYNREGKGEDEGGEGGNKGSNTGLIVVIVVLSVLLICVGVGTFLIYRKYKSKGKMQKLINARATSLAEISGTPQDKLITSQVDP